MCAAEGRVPFGWEEETRYSTVGDRGLQRAADGYLGFLGTLGGREFSWSCIQ